MKIFKKIRYESGLRRVLVFNKELIRYVSNKSDRLEKYNNSWFITDYMKYNGFLSCQKKVKNIILGSSHAMCGFYPDDNDYNFGNSSQDLYLSYNLYKWISSHNLPNIKNIILFYSPFLPGFQLEQTSEAYKCIPYKMFYGIDYANPIKEEGIRLMEKEFMDSIKSINSSIPLSYRGEYTLYKNTYGFIDTFSIATKWTKHIYRENNQNIYLEKIIELAKMNNHHLFIVLPPIRNDLKLFLSESAVLFEKLNDVIKKYKNITTFNFYDKNNFSVLDFQDADHLSKIGALKLAKNIHENIDKTIATIESNHV